MADLILNGKTYTGITEVKIPVSEGKYAHYLYSETDADEPAVQNGALVSTGTQYINTGISGLYSASLSSFEEYVKFALTDVSGVVIPFGAGNYAQLVVQNQKLRIDRQSTSTITTNTISAGTVYEYHEVGDSSNENTTITVAGETFAGKKTSSGTQFLFAQNKDGSNTAASFAKMKLYEYYYSRNGEKVIHLVPSLDDNGVACMYDKVSKTYFYNKGTGVFTYEAPSV